ncbi:MAG: D-alanyl-D-alanine carboxypeptidase/D-alanyl-D-alanine-endopeptidase [Bdellovibrionales bacterium]
MLVRLLHFFRNWSVCFFLFSNIVSAQQLNDWSLNLIKKNKLSPDHFAIFVAKSKDSPFVSWRSKESMLPASITKLLTASAVLHHLPPGSKFKTQLVTEAKIEKGVLKGDLYLLGGGDPSFVSENMWVLVNNFKRNGISEIAGSLIVDDSLFDSVRYDPSRESVRVDRAYDAPVGAMSFNWNSMNVFVRPTARGSLATVTLDPESDYFILTNQVKTVKGKKLQIDVDREWDDTKNKEIFKVRGEIGDEVTEHLVFANIQKPDYWSGNNLKSFLQQRGIQVKGQIRIGKAQKSARVLAEVESKPIELILADMNKFSNNYVSEMLTKNISLKSTQPGSLPVGIQLIKEHLKRVVGKENGIQLVNPSGLTRENRMSAQALWSVLHHHIMDFTSMPEFFSSLPIAGVDGTLKRRFKNSDLERHLRAKTGLLNGVASLAGYLQDEKGELTSFAIMYNGPGDLARVRETMDEILEKAYSVK